MYENSCEVLAHGNYSKKDFKKYINIITAHNTALFDGCLVNYDSIQFLLAITMKALKAVMILDSFWMIFLSSQWKFLCPTYL